MATDYYKILSLNRNATDEEVSKAYRRQIRLWRSRLNAPDLKLRQEAERKLEELDAAKKVLINTKKYNCDRHKSPRRPSPKRDRTGGNPIVKALQYILKVITNICLFILRIILKILLIILQVTALITGFCGFVLFVMGIYEQQFDMALAGLVANYFWMSIPTFLLYRHDKQAARRNQRRTPERQLHNLELCGGWIGAFFAQKLLHHKSKKASFQLVYWLIVFFHLSLSLYFVPVVSSLVIPIKYILIFNAFLLIICLDAIKKKGNVG